MIVHMPNINSKTIVSVFNDAELNTNLPTGSIRSGCIVAFKDTVPILKLPFVLILFSPNGILSSTSITSSALSFFHSPDACCSVSRFDGLCLFIFFYHAVKNGKWEPETYTRWCEGKVRKKEFIIIDITIVLWMWHCCVLLMWQINNVWCSISIHCFSVFITLCDAVFHIRK